MRQQQAPGHQGKQRVRHNRSARSRSRSASSQGSKRGRHNRVARSRKRRSSAGIRRPRRSRREANMKPPLQATYQGGGRHSGTSGASKSTTTSASSAWASWGLRTKPNGNSTVPRPLPKTGVTRGRPSNSHNPSRQWRLQPQAQTRKSCSWRRPDRPCHSRLSSSAMSLLQQPGCLPDHRQA